LSLRYQLEALKQRFRIEELSACEGESALQIPPKNIPVGPDRLFHQRRGLPPNF
jgi:hypothetical protein